MANHKSAEKRIRSNEKRRLRNKASISKVKTLVKNVFASEDKETAERNFKEAVAFIDKTARKGRIHKNTAGRKKSQLAKFVNGFESK